MVNALRALGFLPKDKENLEDETNVTFDISKFLGTLYGLYSTSDICKFIITVGDSNGEVTKTLTFKMNVPSTPTE